jgi:chromosome segregation ATPase
MSPLLVGAIVTVIGAIGTYLGIRVTVKGTRKSKEIDARLAREQSAVVERKESYDQVQENLSGAWEESRKLRTELEAAGTRYRTEIADLWRQLAEVRRQADYEIGQIRGFYRLQKEEDDTYIATLVTHINTRQPPPAPQRVSQPSPAPAPFPTFTQPGQGPTS